MKSISANQISRRSEEPSRMISLNLSDLKTIGPESDQYPSENDLDVEISGIEMSLPILNNPEEYVQLQLHEVNQYEQHYKDSLEILFQKSQGTNYESVIKKLYNDRENSDFLHHEQEKFTIPDHQLFNSQNQSKKNLNFQFKGRSRSSTPTPEEQQKIDLILSKPLPRNMWQVYS
jgi:hypothetical protein